MNTLDLKGGEARVVSAEELGDLTAKGWLLIGVVTEQEVEYVHELVPPPSTHNDMTPMAMAITRAETLQVNRYIVHMPTSIGDQLAAIQSKLTTAENRVYELGRELKRAQEANAPLAKELEEIRGRLESVQVQRDQYKAALGASNLNVSTLEKEVAALKQEGIAADLKALVREFGAECVARVVGHPVESEEPLPAGNTPAYNRLLENDL